MAVSKALYKSTTLRNPQATVSDLMQAANDEVSRDNPEMLFVTAFAGVLDLESGALAYCNAGHVNPYLFHPARGEFVRLTEGAGPPLCTVDRFDYRSGDRGCGLASSSVSSPTASSTRRIRNVNVMEATACRP